MVMQIDIMDSIRILRMAHNEENKITNDFLKDFNSALDHIQADGGAKAVVITGASEKFFCTGFDLGWLMNKPKDEWVPFFLEMDRLLHRLLLYPKPLVSAINGHCFAGGLFIAFCCDYRVMREDRGWCCMPEIDLGIGLPPGTVALISYVLGKRNAELFAITGKRFNAKEAFEMGAIDEIAKAEEVIPRAIEYARLLSGKRPDVFFRHKKELRGEVARIITEDDPDYIRAFMGEKLKG